MKHTTLILFVGFLFSISIQNVIAQSTPFKKQESDHIKDIFNAWDQNNGDYLYESVAATVMHQQQPIRPEGVPR